MPQLSSTHTMGIIPAPPASKDEWKQKGNCRSSCLFGTAELNGEELGSWKISPLSVRTCDVSQLNFSPLVDCSTPCFFRCAFPREKEQELHLDMSGWGMGEVWLNGEYLGSYWERNPQQSLIIQKSMLKEGKNTIVIFELKNKGQDSVKLSDKPVFK